MGAGAPWICGLRAHRRMNDSIQRYKTWYARLLRLYPKPYRERFGEGMQQTFNDLCRERSEAEDGLFGFVLWMFAETSVGILGENMTLAIKQNMTRRLIVWAAVVAALLLIPLVAMQFTEEVNWDLFDFAVMGAMLFGAGLAYELVARKGGATAYRVAVGLALVGVFLLVWINGAVGIIGNEGNPANLMYFGVLVVGLIGAVIVRLQPRGMAKALLAMALAQLLVPVIALMIWQPQVTSWGAAGVAGVFVLNAFFAMLFAVSALLFRHAAHKHKAA